MLRSRNRRHFSRSDLSTKMLADSVRYFGTPQYLIRWREILHAVEALRTLDSPIPIRHWLSLKTHPVRRLVKQWKGLGKPVEVVSEYELRAVLSEGFPASDVLVNGVAKHHWLGRIDTPDLRVHFDSVEEATVLLEHARNRRWRLGIRLHTTEEYDPDEPEFGTQFGLIRSEALEVIRMIAKTGLELEGVHFHLRSNVDNPQCYRVALEEVAEFCADAGVDPNYVDLGGGFPVHGERGLDGTCLADQFDLDQFQRVLAAVPASLPSVKEIWLENGRYLSARSTELILRVLAVKERPECRYLICDGGRTNHALVSDWEDHDLEIVPDRAGPSRLTTICGPTCMAFDRIARTDLPESVVPGDLVVWRNAGAYHIPWETRFSFGEAAVVWDDGETLTLARPRESFGTWWGRWSE